MSFFQKSDPSKTQPSKNLCLGDPVKFKECLDLIIEENEDGLMRLGRA